MREVVFDTETTGLDPYQGHRLVEIGCIELVNRFPTGQTFHRYLNPERDVPPEAFAIHGLSHDFLKSKPLFANIAVDLLAFIGDNRIDRAQCGVRFGLCQRRAGAREAGAHPARPVGRHFAPGAAQISWRLEPSGRSLRPFWN